MEYRVLGSTGKQAGIIGLGCEHLDGKDYPQIRETIDAALAGGINLLDVFMPGQTVRQHIAKALGSRRGDVMIQGHIGSTDVGQQYDICRDVPTVQKYFEDLLRIFGGYIDFGMMFFIDTQKDFEGVFQTPFIDYAQKLKAEGKIGHIGFSSHNPEIATQVIQTGAVESMLFSINLAFDMQPVDTHVLEALDAGLEKNLLTEVSPQRAALYQLCQQKGIGITVMKTMGAGKLLSPQHSPFGQAMTPEQCIHYALTRPGVVSTLVGCQTAQEVEEALGYLTATDAQRDYAPILEAAGKDFHGSCVYCNHCLPCPSQIDIAAVHKYLDIARLDTENIPPSIRAHYKALDHHGDECIACGSCEGRCPFGVQIIQNMAAATQLFR